MDQSRLHRQPQKLGYPMSGNLKGPRLGRVHFHRGDRCVLGPVNHTKLSWCPGLRMLPSHLTCNCTGCVTWQYNHSPAAATLLRRYPLLLAAGVYYDHDPGPKQDPKAATLASL
eukprot:1955075-Rhodomonas_salina.1